MFSYVAGGGRNKSRSGWCNFLFDMKICVFLWMALILPLAAQTMWQEEFAKMPLAEPVTVFLRGTIACG